MQHDRQLQADSHAMVTELARSGCLSRLDIELGIGRVRWASPLNQPPAAPCLGPAPMALGLKGPTFSAPEAIAVFEDVEQRLVIATGTADDAVVVDAATLFKPRPSPLDLNRDGAFDVHELRTGLHQYLKQEVLARGGLSFGSAADWIAPRDCS